MAEGLDPNPQSSADNEDDDSDATISPDEVLDSHLPQEQPKITREEEDTDGDTTITADKAQGFIPPQQSPNVMPSCSVDRYDTQETSGLSGCNRTYGPLDIHNDHCVHICSQNGAHLNRPCCRASSPSEPPRSFWSIPYRSSYESEDPDLALAIRQSLESWKQERELRANEEQDSIRANYALSIMRCRIRDPKGVPDWDEVDPEDPDNFDKPRVVSRKGKHRKPGMVEDNERGTEEKERSEQ